MRVNMTSVQTCSWLYMKVVVIFPATEKQLNLKPLNYFAYITFLECNRLPTNDEFKSCYYVRFIGPPKEESAYEESVPMSYWQLPTLTPWDRADAVHWWLKQIADDPPKWSHSPNIELVLRRHQISLTPPRRQPSIRSVSVPRSAV